MKILGRRVLGKILKKNEKEVYSKGKKLFLRIEGMYCSSCAAGIENFLRSINGILSAKVDFKTGTAHITHDPGVVEAETILQSPIFKEPSSFKAVMIGEREVND